MKRIVPITLAAAMFLLGALSCPGSLRADSVKEGPAISTEFVSGPATDETVVSATALKVLSHIVQARSDIGAKNPYHALDEVKQALTLLDIVQAMDPADRVRTRIWLAQKRLPYESTEGLMRDLSTLYDSVAELEDLVQRSSVREHIGKARKYLESGNKRGVSEELVLADEALFDTDIYLPVRHTRERVEEARNLLMKRKFQKADAALKSAEDGMQFLSIMDYMPTERAGRSVSRAHKNYLAGRFDAAKADLREGRAFLEKALESADASGKAQIEKLIKDIQAVETKVGAWDRETSEEMRNLYLRVKALTVKAAGVFKPKEGKGTKG